MSDDPPTPEEVFALLGNETRIDIIRVLGMMAGEALSFSELHDQVAVRDSGQFNYHLNRLVGTFVRRTEEGTYELTFAGSRVVGAIYSGEFEHGETQGSIRLDSQCGNCGAQLTATYGDETVAINCTRCEEIDSTFGFPSGGVEGRSEDELTRVFDRWLRSIFALIGDGICHNCTGTMERWMSDDSKHLHPDDPVNITFACERCGDEATLSITSFLYLQPEVVGFYFSNGVDLHAVDMWNARTFLDPTVTVVSEQPWEVAAEFEHAGERLDLTVHDDLSITVK